MVALGTHPPMSEEAICERLQITAEERRGKYAGVNVFNHEWGNPAALEKTSAPFRQMRSRNFPMVFLRCRSRSSEPALVRLRPGHHRRAGVSA